MATMTTQNLEVADETARANAVEANKAAAAVASEAHDAIAERNAKHEAFMDARKELADNHERDLVTFDEAIDNRGNRDNRTRAAARDGNVVEDVPVVNIEAHRPDREWLQHEDFPGGVADVQEMKDARDRAERQADRDAIAAEREARESGSAAGPTTSQGGFVREPAASSVVRDSAVVRDRDNAVVTHPVAAKPVVVKPAI